MLPVEPKLGKMLILGAIFKCLDPILTVVAGLSVRDPFTMPSDKKDVSILFYMFKGFFNLMYLRSQCIYQHELPTAYDLILSYLVINEMGLPNIANFEDQIWLQNNRRYLFFFFPRTCLKSTDYGIFNLY